MEIIKLGLDELKPYEKNAKRHPEKQIEQIKKSIEQFGNNDPIAVWGDDNTIVEGHGRYIALKELGYTEAECIRLDHLTDEERKAYTLAHNKLTMNSDFDFEILDEELKDIIDMDMTDFGFELDFNDEPDASESNDTFEQTIRSAFTQNVFENQERMQFTADNYYGIPSMFPTQTTGNQMLRFCDWNEVEDPENYIAHFYYDDIKFMQAWRNPDKYVDKLRKFKAVVSPDFSLYTDFPRCLQILSCYRRQWVGAYWQSLGLDVIPDVVWGDEKSFDYCFLGIPEGGTVAVSTVGVKADKYWNGAEGEMFRDGYNEMMKRLCPSTVLFYGDMIEGLEGNIIRCPSYYEQKRALLNKQERVKDGKRKQWHRWECP